MAKRKTAIAVIAASIDRLPLAGDNPRHAVWIDDAIGLRRITAANPGEDVISVGGTRYQHTRETASGQWVYTEAA